MPMVYTIEVPLATVSTHAFTLKAQDSVKKYETYTVQGYPNSLPSVYQGTVLVCLYIHYTSVNISIFVCTA